MSELKKEIESDKAFIEKVADRIYKDTDDWEETIPEPEWIDRMTEIADRYINRFELAQKIADKWIQCKTPQLNENQQIVFEWLKEEQTKNPELTIFGTLSVLFDESENRFMSLDVIDALNDLSNSQQAGVFQTFSQWALEQEAE